MKLLNSSSSHGWVRRFLSGWEREREREMGREREREICTERERDCLLRGAVMVSSIVMYNFGVGPRGDPMFTVF